MSERPDMNDIQEALMKDDFCESMSDLGYELLYLDEYSELDYYFIDENHIVHFNFGNLEFWTYSRANHREWSLKQSEAKG